MPGNRTAKAIIPHPTLSEQLTGLSQGKWTDSALETRIRAATKQFPNLADFVRVEPGDDRETVFLRAHAAAAAAAYAEPLGSIGAAIARVMPDSARAAAGQGIANPKVWDADVKPMRGRTVDANGFLARVRAAVRGREKGDPLAPVIVRGAEALVFAHRADGVGFARRTFDQMAGLISCCRETARKVIRFLEAHGLLDTFNVLSRAHGQVRRGANLYLIPESPADPPAATDPPSPAGSSLVTRLNRYAAWFGLTPRAWGLNATPAPVGWTSRPLRPAPS